MKKSLYLFFILISLFSFAKNGPNPFAENESDNTFSKTNTNTNNQSDGNHEASLDSGGGNPGDPVPIDNYIPFLVITAVGIMVYHTHKKKKIITKNSAQ